VYVRIASPGPSIFKQKRIGLNGQPFTMFKFRTMVPGADEGGPRFAEENDIRLIRGASFALLAAAIFIPASYYVGVQTGVIKRYQQERINAIIDPESADPRGFGYHTMQSIITVGKGGLSGIKGDPETSQSVLKFLPEPHTDFIFAVTAENTGFIGCVSLLIAYALLLSRLIAGARSASDRPGMLVIMAISTAMVFQIFINVGMTLGFLLVIGVPLPLMSAGLSAILSTFIAIGFVVSVKMRRFVN
jgi:rod shape determining protein RodA